MTAHRGRRIILGLCVWAIVAAWPGTGAYAFFTWGGYDETYDSIRFIKWPLSYMDVNGDGDVSVGEGIEMTFESGEFGWTDAEMAVLRDSFSVWQNVPTAYAAFRYTEPVSDPLEQLPELVVDLINFVAIDTADDPFGLGLPAGVLGITMITFATQDVIFEVVGTGIIFPATGGQIIECEIVINGEAHRPPPEGGEAEFPLKATMVHEIGHLLGMAHTPLNNFEKVAGRGDPPELRNIERRVLALRDGTGTLRRVGATPTMYPNDFYHDDGGGIFTSGAIDLAPDDVSAVSFTYPRVSDTDLFFNVAQESRTQNRSDFPSIPIAGGFVTAWGDVDNNPTTSRVPVFGTMTGLYENHDPFGGRFNQLGLFKQFETFTEELFDANYVFTISPLNGLDPAGQPPENYDSTHLADVILEYQSPFAFFTGFPSEVFREGGNVFGLNNVDQGTPLFFDPLRRKVVSVNSGKTLDTMLPDNRPMFGDPNNICPLNLIVAGLFSMNTANGLRHFRDDVLLNSVVGVALVDMYYHVGPSMARFLLAHPRAYGVAHAVAGVVEWSVSHALPAIAMLSLIPVWVMARRRRKALVFATVALVLAVGWTALPAGAQIKSMTTAEVVASSDDVITGTVTSLTSRWETVLSGKRRIVTDVVIEVDDVMKGRLNKGGKLYFQIFGGQVDGIATIVTELATFKRGEEVLVFLQRDKKLGYQVVAGSRGKYLIETDSATGAKYVKGATVEARAGLADAQKAAKDAGGESATSDSDKRLTLDDFKQFIRDIVQEQKKR